MVVYQPSAVGFNMADVDIIKNLPEVCVPLLKALLASPYRARAECSLKKRISQKRYSELVFVFGNQLQGLKIKKKHVGEHFKRIL